MTTEIRAATNTAFAASELTCKLGALPSEVGQNANKYSNTRKNNQCPFQTT